MNTTVTPAATIEVFIINPHTKTIETALLPKNEALEVMYQLIGCQWIDYVNVGNHDLIIDDEGLLCDPQQQAYFTYLYTENGETIPYTIAGSALFAGYDENGCTIAPSVNLEELKKRVFF